MDGDPRRLAVQQALLEERVLTLERNRLFRWWNTCYRQAAGLYARFSSDDRYGGLADLRTPGDYTRWLSRQAVAMESRPPLRSQPLISIVTSRKVEQSYSRYECVATIAEAKGDYILTLQPGDHLSPHALYFYAQALADDSPPMLYADEEIAGQPLFKPDWSPELAASGIFPGRAALHRRGVDSPAYARHVPRILHYSTAFEQPHPPATTEDPPANTRIAVVICTRNLHRLRKCLKAVRATASLDLEFIVVHHSDTEHAPLAGCTWLWYRGPFDFARMNNLAVEKTAASYVLLMNDDIIVRERGWDSRLAAALARPDIGVAGLILEYPEGTIQHAGVVTGMGDGAGHCGRFQRNSALWPWLRMSRDVSAVTGAMFGMRTDLFRKLGGFDLAFPVNYNDVDMCLRVKAAGLRVVCYDLGKVIHYESQTRIARTLYEERDRLYSKWGSILARPDPFYSPHLAPTERIAIDDGTPRILGLLDPDPR